MAPSAVTTPDKEEQQEQEQELEQEDEERVPRPPGQP